MWIGVVEADGNEARTEHTTIDEARAACESRLRELGYKVAKAKKERRVVGQNVAMEGMAKR